MEWVKRLQGTVVGLDTAPLIYFIEENVLFLSIVQPFFEALDRGEFRAVTSMLTLTEVLVHPMRRGDHKLADRYRRILLHAKHLTTVPVSDQIAEEAAQLRGQQGLRTPDAIQLATAHASGATSFVTNDNRLPGSPSLKMLVLTQLSSKEP